LASVAVAAAVALTWPLARVFTTHVAGGLGDPYVTLWSMRWMHDALAAHRNPFFTDRIYHPTGTTLLFHTFDLPSTLLVAPLWGHVPDVAVYNTAVLLAFALTVYGMSRLVRDMTDDALVAMLAGVLFAAVPYHFAHLEGHLHLMSMGWLPLYLLYLLRILVGRGSRGDAVLAGLFLALACLASWYHLIFAAVLTPPLVLYGLLHHRRAWSAGRVLARLALALLCWGIVAGPLLAAMVAAKQHEPFVGAHDSVVFSADVLSFLQPNVMQTRCRAGVALHPRWGSEVGEHATYVGLVVLLLALAGAVVHPLGRAFLGVALLGAVLAIGPLLHWDGEVIGGRMPYWYAERFLPVFTFVGVPVRFGYVMYLGLIVAAALALARLRARIATEPVATGAVLLLAAAALYDYRWCPPSVSSVPVPPIVEAWAHDTGAWAVLDISNDLMWHATIHGKPIVGGYLGRVPKRVEDWMMHQPVLRAIKWPDETIPVERVDPGIDATWSTDPDLVGDRLSALWTGTLLVPRDGTYDFWLKTSVPARLELDAHRVADTGVALNRPGVAERHARMQLKAGERTFMLRTGDAGRDVEVHLSWTPPGGERTLVPTSVLRAADGTPGLDVAYTQHFPASSGLGLRGGRAALRDVAIRYVITGDADNPCVQQELQLPEIYRAPGIRVYAVPDTDG
jgi:hypothetical protein